MSTNPEFEYLNLKSMYELTSQVLAKTIRMTGRRPRI